MYPAPFEYVRADSYDEAIHLLAEHGDEARLIAGGQSLVPMMHLRLARPALLVDINGVDRSAGPEVGAGWLRLPSMTRQRALERLPAVRDHAPLLATAAAHTGNVRVRSRGTLGGNLAHADPSSELSCAAVAVDARVDVVGSEGSRQIAIGDLFVSDLSTTLGHDEVITAVEVPLRGPGTGYGFAELARRAGEFAVANAAAVMALDADGRCIDVRLAFGGVGPRIFDASAAASDHLLGVRPTPDGFSSLLEEAAASCAPRDDHHASAGYRRRMLVVLGRRALEAAARDARKGPSGG